MLPQSVVHQTPSSSPSAAPADPLLEYLKRILPHIDHRGHERESPFRIDRQVTLIAYWHDSSFVRHSDCGQVVIDIEQLFVQLAQGRHPRSNAWQVFLSRPRGKTTCWTPHFGIRTGRNGDLELTFSGCDRDPKLVEKVNALIEQHWPILQLLEPVSLQLQPKSN